MILEQLLKVNHQNKLNNVLLEKAMLDISIENADKVKNKEAFLKNTFKIEEKFDGCLDYETLIETDNFGLVEIGKVVDENLDCKVKSFNHLTNSIEFKNITAKKNSGLSDNWVMITLENGEKIKITDNHWVWSETKQKYVQVKDLKENEEVLWKKYEHP